MLSGLSVYHLKHFIMYERVLCAVPLRPVNPRLCLHAAEKIVLWFWGRKKCILSEIYDVEVTRNNFNGSVCRGRARCTPKKAPVFDALTHTL